MRFEVMAGEEHAGASAAAPGGRLQDRTRTEVTAPDPHDDQCVDLFMKRGGVVAQIVRSERQVEPAEEFAPGTTAFADALHRFAHALAGEGEFGGLGDRAETLGMKLHE